MGRTLEFYFDYGSPYSYLADTQVEAIAERTSATLLRRPMLLGGVFKATVGLFEMFGPLRVRDTPISELAILGAAMCTLA